MNIEILFDEDIELYSINVNGEVMLECLSKDEVEALTIKELLTEAERK